MNKEGGILKNKRKLKSILVLALILVVLIMYLSCEQSIVDEELDEESKVQINPVGEGVSKDRISVRLYFGYSSGATLEPLLAGENRIIDLPANESVESAIIQELIAPGPSPTRVDFTQLINPDTTVINVELQGQYLFITLSKEFVDAFGEDIDVANEEQVAAENTRKYLAVYSIVNTLVEQGTYSRVSIKIDDNGTARPLTREEAGMDIEDPREPFERNGAIVLNGSNTMHEILTAIEKKEWNTLYGFIANKNYYGQEKPSQDEFINEVTASKLAITNFEIIDSVVSADALTDTIMVNYDLRLQDGAPRTLTNIPIRLSLENDLWKLSYNVFKAKFLTQ